MDYRREIDGLRALAVLPVILFHAGFETFSGGFVGVDVFFVISGYLITTIIITELDANRFSLVNFYERRARRILPVMFLVMLVCIPFAWIILPAAELTNFSKSLAAVPLFVSNFFFWGAGGYFETAAELKPLLHTWSLAVEEQYYVLFPLFLMFFWRRGKRRLLTLLGVFFIASLALAQWGVYAKPTAAFFLLLTRGWELLIGAFAAFYLSNMDDKTPNHNFHEIAGSFGLLLIFYSVFFYNKATSFPGFYALVPTIGTLLIIVFARQGTIVANLIGNKIFVGIGLVSYSAYLWHQPVFAFVRYVNPQVDYIFRLLLILFVFFLSYFSWKYVENLFRSKLYLDRKSIFIFSSLTGGLFVLFGLFTAKIDFRPEDTMAKELSRSPAIFFSNSDERKFIKARIKYETENPHTIVIGSSRVMQIGSEFTKSRTLNLSVSGASIEDIVAIWEMSSDKFNPTTFLIGADPWIFNSNSGQDRWKTLGSEYNKALVDLNMKAENQPDTEKETLLFNEKIVNLYNSINISDIRSSDDSPSLIDKVRKDGSRVYNTLYANKSQVEVERGALSFLNYGMSNYIYSDEAKITLDALIKKIASHQQVVLVLTPYHPILYKQMKNENQPFLLIEEIFKKISSNHGIKIIGSYNPETVGCTSEEFFDGMHPKDSCIEKILLQLH
ncbi:acyltransferase family protein [Limnobacter parvus]|uniref:Acyltransferase n=1 Tax=Limnobacter parvus TaxID=2939690 RepID=A0ABT1XIF0_9BURK|nr:acyltransferase [Limnobacter parvus]MCR2746954.1 acyltransferase [Limnobacter parvus]